jgi:uncharacterized membrane protein
MKGIKGKFIAGLTALIPGVITILILWFLVAKVGGLLNAAFKKIPLLAGFPSPLISLIGFFAVLIFIYLIGIITTSFIGRWVMKFTENIFKKLPLIKDIYTSARQLTDAIFLNRSAFKQVVLLEYPRKGTYTMAFVTNDNEWNIGDKGGNINLFIPTSPNPTSGYYIIAPKNSLIPLSMAIDEAFKVIASGGVILPKDRNV